MKVETQLQALVPDVSPRGSRKRQREVAMVEKRAQAVELRRAGLTYERIGQALGCSEANAHKLVKSALRGIVRAPGDALIEAELSALEDLERKTKMVLDAAHPLVQAGAVVHDIVRDAKGEPIIDPRTKEPLRLPLHDSRPVLAAIAQLLQIHESRRRLLGVDAPKKLSMTDAAGISVPITGMSPEEFEAALAVGLVRHGLGRGRRDVVDVTPADSQSANSEKGGNNEGQ
jgi:methylphosphotriester-DNA--protein-cysteine methyltransferase